MSWLCGGVAELPSIRPCHISTCCAPLVGVATPAMWLTSMLWTWFCSLRTRTSHTSDKVTIVGFCNAARSAKQDLAVTGSDTPVNPETLAAGQGNSGNGPAT